MRVLQINPNGSDASALDLHPTISVITGLGPTGRDIVLRAFEAMAQGSDPGCGGLLEAHGVLFDLTAASIGMLDLTARSGVVVGADDIAAVSVVTPDPSSFDRAQIDQFVEEVPVGRFPDLDLARDSRSNAQEALGILQEAAEKAHARYDDVEAARRRAEADLEVARSAGPRLRLVTEGHADADADDTEVVSIQAIRELRTDLHGAIANFEERGAQINRGLQELSSIDVRPLNVLLDAIKSPSPVELIPSERAQELADDVKLLEGRVAALESELDEQGMGTAEVMRRLEECRAEVANAERSMKKPELSPSDVEELEAAHEVVLAAEQKASSGLFKGGARKALDDAMANQQLVLDRVGFPTWTAYVMGASLLSIDPIAEQRLEKARVDLELAEEHWARITQAIESNPEHGALLNKLEEVYLEAYDLLGGEEPEDLESALRNLQVPKREVTTEELADALSYQLELLGLPLGEKPSVDLVVMAAEAFVEEAAAISGRITELRDERAKVDAQLANARMRLAELPEVPDEVPEPLPTFSGFDSFGAADAAPADDPFASLRGGDGDDDADGAADVDGGADPFGEFGSFESFIVPDEDAEEEEAPAAPGGGDFSSFDSFDSFPSLVPEDDDEYADGDPLADDEIDIRDGADGPEVGGFQADDAADEEDRGKDDPLVSSDTPTSDAGYAQGDTRRDAEAAAATAAASSSPEDSIEDLERRLEVVLEEEEEYKEWVESRDALVDTALQILTVANTKLSKLAAELMAEHGGTLMDADGDGIPDVEAVTAYLHQRLGSLRSVSFAGSVPLVLDDALRALPSPDIRQVLTDIEPDAATVQLVYLTDDPDLIGWADEVGFQRAAVVDAPPAFR